MENTDHGRRRHVSALLSQQLGFSLAEVVLADVRAIFEGNSSSFSGGRSSSGACYYLEAGPGLTSSGLGFSLNIAHEKHGYRCTVLAVGRLKWAHGDIGRKQKAIISRESTMAAGQVGKVPGAPPRNPTAARSRDAT